MNWGRFEAMGALSGQKCGAAQPKNTRDFGIVLEWSSIPCTDSLPSLCVGTPSDISSNQCK